MISKLEHERRKQNRLLDCLISGGNPRKLRAMSKRDRPLALELYKALQHELAGELIPEADQVREQKQDHGAKKLTGFKFCKRLDAEHVRIRAKWEKEGFRTWVEAWRDPQKRACIAAYLYRQKKSRKPLSV